VVGLVVDLAASDAERLPGSENARVTIAGITLRRLAMAAGEMPLSRVAAAVHISESGV